MAILQGRKEKGTWGHAGEGDKIVFDVGQMNESALGDDTKTGVIAHELAHLFWAHMDASQSDEELREIEEEADEKASEWGSKKEIDAMRSAQENLRNRDD